MLLLLALSAVASAFVVDLANDGQLDSSQTRTIELPSVVLAERAPLRVIGPRGGALRATADFSCVVPLADGKGTLASNLDGCASLYELSPQGSAWFVHQIPPSRANSYRFVVAAADPGGSLILSQSGDVMIGGDLGEVVAGAVWLGGRWYPATVDASTRTLGIGLEARAALVSWLSGGSEDLVVRLEERDAPREKEWRAAPVWVPQVEREEAERARAQASVDWCTRSEALSARQPTLLVCLDSEGQAARSRRYDRDGEPIAVDVFAVGAGTYLEVATRHLPGQQVQLELGEGPAPEAVPQSEAGMVVRETSRRVLPPPRTGSHHLSASIDGQVRASRSIEVADRYFGAIRLGLAVTGPASRAYTTGEADDTGMAPIERRRGDRVDGELVVGFAPFLEPEGRDYLLDSPLRLAPQIGLGLLAANGSSVRFTALQSYHLGGEVEFAPGLALSTSLTLRRVPRLPKGLDEGDRIAATTDVETVGAIRPGLSLALSYSPKVLRLTRSTR